MLDGLAPDLAPRLLIAIGGVAIAFLVLIAVLLFLRRRNSPLFVKGGHARAHRLLVLDAAAVDAKRRLVLIRRDDTEHLIMIGGPSDIVIETGIGGAARPRPVAAAAPAVDKPAERPVATQKPSAVDRPAGAQAPSNVVAIPARHPEAGAAARQGQGQARPNGEPRPANGANRDDAQKQRRMERRAARAAAAAKAGQTAVVAGAAAASALPGTRQDAHSAPTNAGTPQRPVAAPQQPTPVVAARAENPAEQVRGAAVNAPASRSAPPSNEDAIRQLEEQLEAGKTAAARAEAARAEAARQQIERATAAKAEAARAEAARAEAARVEEAQKAEAARLEAQRAEAARLEAQRAEASRLEAQRAEAARVEAQKAEAARLEAERAERARQEAQRAEAARAEAARIEAEEAEAARADAARMEAERLAAARAEAMARFEAARRAQAEQRDGGQPGVQASADRQQQPAVQQWPVAETRISEPQPIVQAVMQQPQWPIVEPPSAEPAEVSHQEAAASLDEEGSRSQERLASDFEKLLEAELEADGILDNYPAPTVAGERREASFGAPGINPAKRDSQPITGAVPGISIEQDMARRLGEISLSKKTDAL